VSAALTCSSAVFHGVGAAPASLKPWISALTSLVWDIGHFLGSEARKPNPQRESSRCEAMPAQEAAPLDLTALPQACSVAEFP
jgi:hypothetical protein